MEVVVLKRLQSCSPHICILLGCGRTDRINYMVMSLLGPNLSELRKQQPNQKFSLSTTLRVGVQVIAAVRAMHNCGFLHRDIKPSNFAIGPSSVTKQTCYMLDFGLARQYVTPTGEIRPPRPVAGFRGTVRYASINAHQSKDLGRHDDLWSVFYLLVELVNGELPWKKLRDKDKAGKFKLSFDHKRLLKHLPAEFFDFLDHLKSLDYFQEPDYVMLSTLLQNAIRYLGVKRSDPLDWEQDASVQSLTTVSVGSAPALHSSHNTAKGKAEEVGREGDSRTHVSTEDCMSQNDEKKEGKIARKTSDENAGNRSTKISALVQSKRHKQLNLLQQRRSMPPSPLLQATHLVQQNDSRLPHTNSLDRFFDMRPARSHSLSGSGNPEEKESLRDEEVGARVANSPEEERSFSNKAHCGKHTEGDGYEQLKSESNGGAPEVIVENESGAQNLVNGEIDGQELEQLVGTNQVSPKSQVLHQYGVGEIVGPTEVHPDKTPPPQLGYGTEKLNGEDGERGEQSTPSESSCFQHRLFACSVQNRAEEGEVDNAEQVPLEMIPRTRSREVHSPGPPPLEFHQERPQTMWGHDATRPISLSQVGQLGERSGDPERMVMLPRPPDHPPPKHYTLLAARRRRFRRPAGKT